MLYYLEDGIPSPILIDLRDLVAGQFQQLEATKLAKFVDIILDMQNAKKTCSGGGPCLK